MKHRWCVRAVALLTLALPVLAIAMAAAAAPDAARAPARAGGPVARGPRGAARGFVDDFEDISKWSAHPADGVGLVLRRDVGLHGHALRLDFSFSGGGYAVARRAVALDLPSNYRFRFAVKGDCLPNDLEFKLVDSSGENVWWCNRRGFHFPTEWDSLSTKKRQIQFAWGPRGGGDLRHVAAVELVVTAGGGGTGTVWFDDLTLEPLPPPGATPPAPRATASSARTGHPASLAIDRDRGSSWVSATRDSLPWLALDLGVEREFGGLVLDWAADRPPRDYAVESSGDGRAWRVMREVRDGDGGRDALFLPESEARHLRVRALAPVGAGGVGLRSVEIRPLEFGASISRFFEALAKDAPHGAYPRGLSGEQTFWSVVGPDGGRDEGLLSEDGMLETGKAQFSVEPFLRVGERFVTWADVTITRGLEDGDRPIPSVTWSSGDLGLTITAFAVDSAGGASAPMRALARRSAGLVARYRVTNHGASEARVTLDLALRPFQVNPPAQFLNTPGGVAPIRGLSRSGAVVVVNGDRGVASLTPPSGFGAAGFDQGDVVEALRAGALPARERADDPFEHASGALEYALAIPAAGEREVDLFVPFAGIPDAPAEGVAPETVELEERACAGAWRDRETAVTVELPDSAAEVTRTLRAQLAWILINRDGPAIQPGSRSYERSWIRDGALTSSALLRLGHPEEVRDFIEWFARYLYPDGKVPCCVDARGADPVPEHDSGGEFIFLVAEYFRYTGDRALVESLWPAVARAAAHLDTLRQERRTAAWRAAGKEEFFGLLPPSISHEGYSAKPMHSYWDDFFALRGFKDAALLAAALGDERERARLAAVRDTFARDLAASVRAAMARHGIDYVPGCADLGDFDATSTTIALAPAEAEDLLPPGALEKTFERYWENFRDRRDGAKPWVNFTPYEIRTIGAFVRLGWRDRANQLLDFFLAHRSPPEWAQWAEVVWRDARTPHFIGDLPHTWVGSDYVRSVLDMLAYSRERDDALVIGAGVPRAWVERAPGVTVRGLPTPYGPLSYRMAVNRDTVVVSIATGIRVPPGGIVVSAPSTRGFGTAWVDGALVEVERGGGVSVRHLPAEVRLIP